MGIKAKLLAAVSAMLLLGIAGSAAAADTGSKEPGDQGLTSIDKNLRKDPDNRGLENAQDRHERNQLRQETREKADRDHVARLERPERPERPDRPERGR